MRTLPVLLTVALVLAGCSTSTPEKPNPGMAPRGTTMTTAKPTRQDLTNRVSLTGKVAIDPVFGIVAPVAGQIRYLDVKAPEKTPTKPTKVATIGKTSIEVPAGAIFSGRLVDDKATVTAGMPIVSAKHVGYGIVAEITGDQAYKLSDALSSVQAQIKNGPGPFPCTALGTIAALPAGTIPDPPVDPNQQPQQQPGANLPQPPGPPQPPAGQDRKPGQQPSTATGMRLVCTPAADVKLINGAEATVEVVTETAANVLVVPVEAVAGAQGKGKVDVLASAGTRQTKDVELGLTDGKVVQVKSGLTGDETLAVPGPNLPPGPDNGGGGKGGMLGGPSK
ncbi:efflux RND transporter periplasmic adaptor subunit [Actinocrispum wychmicini]|uniref:Multidrug efflux pump subunit AcrA (Membrane-fusion protein) n=1 Tax=Actinocrispum wychmicini TaxID=1213861 RepID=A0A4R2JEA6_9PSEU|nr:efflux RND transporter periplasmic adaptor subunit [Actinocrispum wychmicini]TCO55158.1 multidrug efflux pump subunit AcrA (membrane-fusion protein) [Actinocrispum wychmicini]